LQVPFERDEKREEGEERRGRVGWGLISKLSHIYPGALAGTFGTILNTPADVVKSRIQNQPKDMPRKYNWTIPSLAIIAREEGPRALYKGFVPKVFYLSSFILLSSPLAICSPLNATH
jgi:hypothetical protein